MYNVDFQKNEEENDIDGSTLLNEKENNSSNHNESVDSVKSNKSKKKKSVRNNRLAGLRRRRVNGDAAAGSDGQYQFTLVQQKQEMTSLPRKQTYPPPAIPRHSFHRILKPQQSLHHLFVYPHYRELSVLLQNFLTFATFIL